MTTSTTPAGASTTFDLSAMRLPAFTPQQLSERTGRAFANLAILDMLHSPDQAMRLKILVAALSDLQRLPHADEASRGFAEGLMCMLEIGFERAYRNQESLYFGEAPLTSPATKTLRAAKKPSKS